MKKIIGVVLLIISIVMIVKGSMLLLKNKTYLIRFTNIENSNEFEIIEGGYIQIPNDPIKEGYTFIGWYHNEKLFDFNTPVLENIELEAKWEKIS